MPQEEGFEKVAENQGKPCVLKKNEVKKKEEKQTWVKRCFPKVLNFQKETGICELKKCFDKITSWEKITEARCKNEANACEVGKISSGQDNEKWDFQKSLKTEELKHENVYNFMDF